jgi:hypothetical protein
MQFIKKRIFVKINEEIIKNIIKLEKILEILFRDENTL